MQAIYLLATLVTIGWLVVWSILPKPYDGKGWWPLAWSPFDMREGQETVPADIPTDIPTGRATRRGRAAAGGQQRLAPGPSPVAPAVPAGGEATSPVSWRVRAQSNGNRPQG